LQGLLQEFQGASQEVPAGQRLREEEGHEGVQVSGSTRFPKVQSMIQEFFTGKGPNRSINPVEAAVLVPLCRRLSSRVRAPLWCRTCGSWM
jgi:molecular chaperone DnaK (HSP70)